MLQPKKTKFRRRQKGRMRGRAERGSNLAFGTYGLQATSCGFITARQVEAARIAITRHIKRGGKVWIRIFPDKPLTAKPTETRMGKGKGNTTDWVVVIKPGRIMYELEGVTPEVAQEAIRLAGHKLPVGTRYVSEEN